MKRALLLVLFTILLLAFFGCNDIPEPISKVRVEYLAEAGGYITGQATQEQVPTAEGETVTFSQVSAIANKNYRFVGWDDGKTEPTRVDTLTESKKFTAVFEKIPPIVVEYVATEGGSIIGQSRQEIVSQNGESVDFSLVIAKPDNGYIFLGWDDGVTNLARRDSLTESKTFTAKFKLNKTVSIDYFASEGGHIEGVSHQFNDDGPFTGSEVVAVAGNGYRFVEWDDGLKSSNRSDFADTSKSFVAIFVKVHIVNFTCNSLCGSITGDLNQILDDGQDISPVVATAEFGYKFVGWSNGEKDPTLNMKASNTETIEAIFAPDELSLPIISINTVDFTDITSKEIYLNCSVSVENTEAQYSFENAAARIRGRGNSTWDYEKKPYRLKFNSSTDMFGNGAAKDWTLIANHSDLSMSRNYLAQSLASIFDSISATTSVQFVELYLNYEYKGVYLLCEQIEVQKTRVDISEDLSSVDTGYLLELDGRADGYAFTVNGKYYVIKSPDTDDTAFTTEHRDFISAYLSDCLNAARQKDYERVKELIDVESFAEAYIIHEIFNSADVGYASFYLYKEAGGKLYAGPVWDFDRSLGIVGNTLGAKEAENLWAKAQNPWFGALLTHDGFLELVSQKLNDSKTAIENKLSECYAYLYKNRDSFDRNFVRWEILGTFVWPNDDELTELDTWDLQVEYTRDYITRSLDYIYYVYE